MLDKHFDPLNAWYTIERIGGTVERLVKNRPTEVWRSGGLEVEMVMVVVRERVMEKEKWKLGETVIKHMYIKNRYFNTAIDILKLPGTLKSYYAGT